MITPSRKIIAVGIVCVALIGSVAYVKVSNSSERGSKNGVLTTVALPEFTVPINATEDVTDSDADGLKDWQEIVQGTDIHDSDTDGDGTKDGAEIEAGRNPLKPGPDDEGPSTAELTIGTNEIYENYVPQSFTDNVSKNLFATYIKAKSQAGGGEVQNLNDIAKSIAQETLAQNDNVEKYTAAAVGSFPDSDLASGREYGEKFGNYYIGMLESVEASPNDLKIIAGHYQTFSKNISAMYVPESLVQTQVDIANNFYNVAIMFSIVADSDKDPIRAALALRNVKELIGDESRLFTAVANYFIRNDIMFENEEIQRLWANI